MMKSNLLCSVLLSCVFTATGCFAGNLPNIFICGAAEGFSCSQDQSCVSGSAKQIALPLLWKVNVAEKNIVSIREDGERRNSKILDTQEVENGLILLGIDHSTPWSIFIDTIDGKMTLTSTTRDAGFIIHGACSSKILE